MSEPDYKTILLKLCASLTQVDHMGAAWENVETALKYAGIDTGRGGSTGVASALGQLGVTTFNGNSLAKRYEPYY